MIISKSYNKYILIPISYKGDENKRKELLFFIPKDLDLRQFTPDSLFGVDWNELVKEIERNENR